MDREDVISMAIDAGLDCYANNANKKMNEPLDEMESNYVDKLALFASFVYKYAYAKRDNEALTKNIIAMWPYSTWVGLTDDEMEGLYESTTYMDKTDCIHLLTLAADKLKEKNGG